MYDSIIIGGGPAGLSASIYASRAGMNALLVEASAVDGGQVLSTYEVDNYPGLMGISGMDLGAKFSEHAGKLGIERVCAEVLSISGEFGAFKVTTDNGEYDTKTVIVATGARHAMLNVPGEEELQGMGVSYCATCDGAFFKNADVCVVGGSDVAVEDAAYLARTSKHVYLIHRRDSLRAAQSLINALQTYENVSFVWNTEVKEIIGEDEVTEVLLYNNKTGENSKLSVQGVFVAVGINPVTALIGQMVDMSADGYVLAGEDARTSVKGIYAAGDIRKKPLRQIITAVADGANAIASVQDDLRSK